MATHFSKVALKGEPSNPPPTKIYNIVNQLKKIHVQIYIFELLYISPTHKEILNKYLHESIVPHDIDVNAFQDIVVNLFITPRVTFRQKDILANKPFHNDPLHLEVFDHKYKIRRVLINGGVGLNIYTLNLVEALGNSKQAQITGF